MTRNLEVEETIQDRKSLFSVKRFRIGNLKIESPIKTVDTRILERKAALLKEVEKDFKTIILERSRLVSDKNLKNLLYGSEREVNKFFKFRGFMKSYPRLFPQTLTFNPLEKDKNLEYLSGYFSYLHSFSDPLVFVPNIKIERYDEKTGKMKRLLDVDDFIRFVHEAYRMLDYKNKKPILVPLSLRFAIEEIRKIAKEYIKSEYYSVWIDFEGSAISLAKISRVRSFFLEFEQAGRIDDLVVFATNIKREIISNIKSEKAPASDALATLIGSNLVGVNREPQRPPHQETASIKVEELRAHKARVFEPSTYYYLKPEASSFDEEMRKRLFDPAYNTLLNSKLLDREFHFQAKIFLEEGDIEKYIAEKQMIREYKSGEFGEVLFRRERKLVEWY